MVSEYTDSFIEIEWRILIKKYIMKRMIYFIIVLFLHSSIYIWSNEIGQTNVEPVFNMQEFHQRGGLPNVFYKIGHQRQVRIGYIGGSITEAKDGWRDLTFHWFRLTYPYTTFYQIDASLGGTGSDLGVFRLEHEMLSSQPDLLFIEFAVNDAGRTREQIIDSMEGIIRKVWTKFPETDICLVYTTVECYCADLVKGKQHHASLAMEELADYYNIPSIHVGIEIARLYSKGQLLLSANPEENRNKIVFTKDKTHPLSESGHPLYASVVTKYLEQMKNSPHVIKHSLGKPYAKTNWENVRFIDVQETQCKGEWEKLSDGNFVYDRFKSNLPSIYKAKPGATMEFSFNGSDFGFNDCIGWDTGMIRITVDGKVIDKSRFDQWCGDYRKHNFMLGPFKEGLHHVKVEVTGQPMDKDKILSKENVKINEPEKYVGLNWYPAYIMIVGKLETIQSSQNNR